jgi:hypothetical protein
MVRVGAFLPPHNFNVKPNLFLEISTLNRQMTLLEGSVICLLIKPSTQWPQPAEGL